MLEKIYDNRELSWLKFNERVLAEAQNISVPLLERLTFVSIFSSNLDEFFRVRVGSWQNRLFNNPLYFEDKTQMNAKRQLEAIYNEVSELIDKKGKVFNDVTNELIKQNIKRVSFEDVSDADKEYLEGYFKTKIMPEISFKVIEKKTDFLFLNNFDVYLIAQVKSKSTIRLGFVRTCDAPERIIYLPGEDVRYILVEDLILQYAQKIFKGYFVEEKGLVRVTRSANIDMVDNEYFCYADANEAMQKLLKARKKLYPVRLEVDEKLSNQTIDELCKIMMLDRHNVFTNKAPFDLSYVFELKAKFNFRKDLLYNVHIPKIASDLNGCLSVMSEVMNKDIMLYYPFDSVESFISLINEAAEDPEVVSIKMTIYRVVKGSKVVSALVKACDNGKDVTVLVELRARFDEQNNIDVSKRLEKAGCKVIYGLQNMKVHCKLLLIQKRVQGELKHITQIGTGNYNEKTALQYTDFCFMTANEDIAMQVSEVFTTLIEGKLVQKSKDLLVAPLCLRSNIIKMLDEEICYAQKGGVGYFFAKINSLSDKVVIDKLIEASQAGVKIDLVVRGICCLVAGVKGYTDNIKVTSIVGRFLEHSRIYIFGEKERQKVYISSADLMTRNTVKRVEVAVNIKDEAIVKRIIEVVNVIKQDNVNAWLQLEDGKYIKVNNGEEIVDSQKEFL